MQLYTTIAFKTKLLLLFLLVGQVYAYASTGPVIQPPPQNLIKIIENKGQWPHEVLFRANIPGGTLDITANGLVYHLIDEAALHNLTHGSTGNSIVKGHNYKMTFENANASVWAEKQNPSYEVYNYFIGNDPSLWASDCKAYQTVILKNIYPGIDAEIVAKEDFIKLNFIVAPYVDPDLIRLQYEGMDLIVLKEQALSIQTSVATIKEDKPVAIQGYTPVDCKYILTGNKVQFNLGSYNRSQQLVIDPEIVFGTYSGSVADNFGYTGTYDDAGNGYAGGTVYGSGFPVTLGAFQVNFAGGSGSPGTDIGILKFTADGKSLIYATYIGGGADEQPHSLVCNSAGELFIMGTSESFNYPTSITAFDRTFNGSTDIVVSKLSATGNQLLGSTFFGGWSRDGINAVHDNIHESSPVSPLTRNYGDFFRGEILLDQFGQVYVASTTQSTTSETLPILGGFQQVHGGGNQDGLLFSLTPNLSKLNFSTYLGGNGNDAIYGLKFDSENNLFVCGGTTSSDLPFSNPFPYRGGADGFVAKINTINLTLDKLIHLGTTAYDQAYFIDIDPSDHIYVSGQTLGNYPVKGNVYQNANSSQFISILNKTLDSIMYSTVIGSGFRVINLSPSAFMVDNCGKVYLSGWGGETNNDFHQENGYTSGLTITPDAFQKTTDGSDFYLIILSENLANLTYATFMGGPFSKDHVDGGTSRFDKKGAVYQSICAGCPGLSDLPVTPGCYSPTNKGKRPNSNGGGCNNALIKFSADPYNYPPAVKDTLLILNATDTLNYTFTITNPIGDSVKVDFNGVILMTPGGPKITKSYHGKKANVSMVWNTTCANASSDTFMITAQTQLSGCFGFRMEMAVIKILVRFPPPVIPPYPNCLKTINDSTIRISWTETNYGKYFKKLDVYKSTNGNPFEPVAKNLKQKDTAFIDPQAHDHLNQNICYYFVGTNICDSVSALTSRYICSLYPYDSADHIFDVPSDTMVYITATDTLDFTFTAQLINPEDSVFIAATGSVFQTNRVISFSHTPQKHKADYRIIWRSACEDVNLTDTLTVKFLVRDNQCPQSRTKHSVLKIVVLPPPLVAPPLMKCTRNINENSVLVRWEKPTVPARYFSHFIVLRKNADGTFTEIKSVYNDSALSFEDKTATNNENENICYAGYGINVCDKHGDTSEFVCTVNKTINIPDPLYIYTTTVVKNNFLSVQWSKSNDRDFLKYQVFKKNTTIQNDYTYLTETTNINDTIFNDKGTDVHHNVYCYKLLQVNDCGMMNQDAYQSCSILLKGKSNPFVHSLNWNDYEYWSNGVNYYIILRDQPETGMPTEEFSRFNYNNTVAEDRKLNTDNGLYHYTIRAAERKSSITSVSNTVELIQAPLLHVPNVFTVNGDGLNDVWQPVPVFVKEYEMQIFNRWGQLVFETKNKKEPFSGEFNTDPTTADVFVYLITYTGWDGSVHKVSGNVTQLK